MAPQKSGSPLLSQTWGQELAHPSRNSRSVQLDRELAALRPTHHDRRGRHRHCGKTAAHDAHRLDPPRPGVVLRPSPVNPRPQRGQLDSALAREHGLSLSARAIGFDQLLPLTAVPLPSRPLHHLGFPALDSFIRHPTGFCPRRRQVQVERLQRTSKTRPSLSNTSRRTDSLILRTLMTSESLVQCCPSASLGRRLRWRGLTLCR